MSELNHDVKVRCNKCGETFIIPGSSFDVQEEIEDEEREMGAEIYYSSIAKVHCPHCGNKINIELEQWEYPIGCPSPIERYIEGARFSDEK